MGVSTTYGLSGYWQDGVCGGTTATYHAICEMVIPAPETTVRNNIL
jgi:hypothetical protein